MEMCYQGTLAMPKSYAVMDQDEMMYVEGGKFTWAKAKSIAVEAVKWLLGAIFGVVISKTKAQIAINAAGAWVYSAFETAILAVMVYPEKVGAVLFAAGFLTATTAAVYKTCKRKGYCR